MNEERSDFHEGVINNMLLSLEEEHTDSNPPAAQEPSVIVPLPESTCEDSILELDGEFNYDGYQVVRREFFAHINEPSVTFNNYKFYVNVACLKKFPQAEEAPDETTVGDIFSNLLQ